MSRKPSKTQEQLEFEHHIRNRRYDLAHTAISQGAKYGAPVGIAYFVFRAVDSLSGKFTVADIDIDLLVKLAGVASKHFNSTLVALLFFALILAYCERRLRLRAIREFGDVRKRYEELVDPNRSSSRLMEDGQTRPED